MINHRKRKNNVKNIIIDSIIILIIEFAIYLLFMDDIAFYFLIFIVSFTILLSLIVIIYALLKNRKRIIYEVNKLIDEYNVDLYDVKEEYKNLLKMIVQTNNRMYEYDKLVKNLNNKEIFLTLPKLKSINDEENIDWLVFYIEKFNKDTNIPIKNLYRYDSYIQNLELIVNEYKLKLNNISKKINAQIKMVNLVLYDIDTSIQLINSTSMCKNNIQEKRQIKKIEKQDKKVVKSIINKDFKYIKEINNFY